LSGALSPVTALQLAEDNRLDQPVNPSSVVSVVRQQTFLVQQPNDLATLHWVGGSSIEGSWQERRPAEEQQQRKLVWRQQGA
jgi:hypothetical protein